MVITLTISTGVHCEGLPRSLAEKIKKNLTFDNPKYINAKKYGKFISQNDDPYLYFFAEDTLSDTLFVPRGYIWYLKRQFKKNGVVHKTIDYSLTKKPINVKFHGELRDYQKDAVHDMSTYPIGVLEADTGAGKTICGIYMISVRKQPTLIIVHSKELLHQWKNQIEKFLKVTPGIIGDGKKDIKDITIGIINSVNSNIEELKERFGHIICDEVHRCPSAMWTNTLANFPAKYYLGLSATAFRNDGLDKAINAFIGPKRHVVNRKMLQRTGAVLKPEIIRCATEFVYNYRGDYSSLVSALVRDKERNEYIVDTAESDLKNHKSAILIVSDRVNHCEEIARLLRQRKIKSNVLTSAQSKTDRVRIVEEIRAGEIRVLVSTLSLIAEGFDAPNLHSLLITTPIKYEGRLRQVVGRVLRPEEDKTARVYDFWDYNIPALRKSGDKRYRLYMTLWG